MKQNNKLIFYVFLVISLSYILSGCNSANIKESDSQAQNEATELIDSLGLNVTSVNDAIQKGDKALQKGKVDLAQFYFTKGYELEPQNIQVLQKLANLYSDTNNHEMQEFTYKLILKQQPNDIKIIEQYGLLLMKMKRSAEAEEQLMQSISIGKPSWQALNGLGIIADLQNRHEDANAYFKEAEKMNPGSPELLNNIGFSYYLDSKFEQAEHYYIKALQSDSGFKKALYNLSLVQAKLRNYDAMYQTFIKLVDEPEANNNAGYLAMMNGDYKQAEVYLNKAMRLSPRYYKKAHDNLQQLEMMK